VPLQSCQTRNGFLLIKSLAVIAPLDLANRFGVFHFSEGDIIKVTEQVTKEHPVDSYMAGLLLRYRPNKVRIEDGPKVVDSESGEA